MVLFAFICFSEHKNLLHNHFLSEKCLPDRFSSEFFFEKEWQKSKAHSSQLQFKICRQYFVLIPCNSHEFRKCYKDGRHAAMCLDCRFWCCMAVFLDFFLPSAQGNPCSIFSSFSDNPPQKEWDNSPAPPFSKLFWVLLSYFIVFSAWKCSPWLQQYFPKENQLWNRGEGGRALNLGIF